ncbi:hypothetical protein DW797_00675 [Ruminococcus sp. AM31-32]|nr:hypothetical protein DW797_00675 [Ruminococcus sp. AM31-32]
MNQPIPTRGRKFNRLIPTLYAVMNQPIPKRGRKIIEQVKIIVFFRRTNPSPSGDEKKHLPKSVGALSYDMKFMCFTMEYILRIYFQKFCFKGA